MVRNSIGHHTPTMRANPGNIGSPWLFIAFFLQAAPKSVNFWQAYSLLA